MFSLGQATLDNFDAAVESVGDEYVRANPWPHLVIDNVVADELIEAVSVEFPLGDDPIWQHLEWSDVQVKSRTTWQDERDMGSATRELVRTLNSGRFLRTLSQLTGVPHLLGDPYLAGGGLNAIAAGGLLDVHCDGNRSEEMNAARRLNVIVFLNRDWEPAWGGQLELWSPDLQRCVTAIEPTWNRMVVFETTDRTFHGHPTPLACPPHQTRRSLILYYYTASAPSDGQTKVAPEGQRARWRSRGDLLSTSAEAATRGVSVPPTQRTNALQ